MIFAVAVAALTAGFLLGVKFAPTIYLLHAELHGLKSPPPPPEQGREHAP